MSPLYAEDAAPEGAGRYVRLAPHNGVVPRFRNAASEPGGSTYSVLSVYAGAGGLDLGFRRAGFDLLWAIDSDRDAVLTYRENLGGHIVHGDLPDHPLPVGLRPDVVIGGPPCQGFSVAGRMDPNDPRSEHVLHFLDVVDRYEPAAFCMENVGPLAHGDRWAEIREQLVRRAHSLGYATEMDVLNAADFGVPQARERMFFVGIRDGRPRMPLPRKRARRTTVGDALRKLPPYGEAGNDTLCPAKIVAAPKPVMRPSPYRGSLLFNGSGRVLALDAPARTLPASMGGNATPIIDQLELEEGAAPWVVGYHKRLLRGGAPVKRVPARMRRLTVEEAALLQTFPHRWKFQGSVGSQFRQIGNAVPPKLAYAVALSIQESLSERLAGADETDRVAA